MSNIKNKQHYVFQAYLKNWCNEDDKLWVCNKKDNTGDNISAKNPNFCELTSLYWAWKSLVAG